MTTIDLTAIRKQWLALCGPCDAGLPMECSHPNADYRPVMAALCDEIDKLRAEVAQARAGLDADEWRSVAHTINAYIRLCGSRIPEDHSLRSIAAKLAEQTGVAVAR